MPTLREIERAISALNGDIESIIDTGLIRDIEKYQRDYERGILKKKFELTDKGALKRTAKNFQKAISGVPGSKLSLNELASLFFENYDVIAQKSAEFVNYSIDASLEFRDISAISRLRDIDFSSLQIESEKIDSLVKKQLVNAIALQADWEETVDNLSKQLLGAGVKEGSLARYATTYMRTSLFGVSNTVSKEMYDKLGGDKPEAKYLYAGPVSDSRIRDFCYSRVGNIYTLDEINNFPSINGSGIAPFFSPGGWNCRHRLILVRDSV